MNNLDIAKVLYEIANLLEMQGVPFKPQAYIKAARTVESLSEDINDIAKNNQLTELPGIGENIAKKIEELLRTGKLDYYDKLKKSMPMDVDALMAVPSLGPKRILLLYQKLRIKTLSDLKKAAEQHRIQKIPGLGPKVEEEILKGISIAKTRGSRFLLGYITPIAEEIRSRIRKLPSVRQVEVAGSYRRKQETVGDIDILVTSSKPKEVMDFFTKMPDVADIIANGTTRSAVRLHNGLQVDIRVLKEKEYGSALQYFTGSKEHNVALRKLALSKGYTLSEYGLFRLKDKRWIAGKTEKDIYSKLGLDLMPPELRTSRGELEAAKKHALPRLVERKNIFGDFQMHTEWSDGSNSIRQMAEAAAAMGYKFIAITDHVGQLAITNTLDEKRLMQQAAEIDKLSKKLDIRIFKSAEVDILKNGRLALSKKAQEKLDVVLGSVHLSTKMSSADMTKRICSALENDRIHILAHPTGRLIQERNPFEFDMNKVFETAKRTDTFLEINGQPKRMDLNDTNIMLAKKLGCRFVLSTDSHSTEQLHYIDLALANARRGWLESKDILNTHPIKKIEAILRKK